VASTYIELAPIAQATIIGEVEVSNDSGNPVPVTAIDLDIRNLTFADDKVDVSGSTLSLTATDLDIRDLQFATDSVDVSGSTIDVASITNPVAVTQSGTWDINNISGTVSLPTGAATEATLSTLNGKVPANLTVTATRLLVDGSGVTQPVSGTITATNETVATSTLSNVAGSATSVSVLASTPGRKMAVFFNDSSATAYLKLGTTASTSSYTVLMRPYDYYELPQPVYTGAIDAIWDSATGNLRVTELS